MTAQKLGLDGPLLLEPEVHKDSRGHFFEAWNDSVFAALIDRRVQFVQDNQSRSGRGVVRGLHYQLPNPQGKLVAMLEEGGLAPTVDQLGLFDGTKTTADRPVTIALVTSSSVLTTPSEAVTTTSST